MHIMIKDYKTERWETDKLWQIYAVTNGNKAEVQKTSHQLFKTRHLSTFKTKTSDSASSHTRHTVTTTPVLQQFYKDNPGEPVPETIRHIVVNHCRQGHRRI